MIEQPLQHLTAMLIDEARSDVVNLSAILWEVKRILPELTGEIAKAKTIAIVKMMLEEGILAGQFGPIEGDEHVSPFVPWKTTTEETVRRITHEWELLARAPYPGDIAWFVAPTRLPYGLLPS